MNPRFKAKREQIEGHWTRIMISMREPRYSGLVPRAQVDVIQATDSPPLEAAVIISMTIPGIHPSRIRDWRDTLDAATELAEDEERKMGLDK